MAQPPMRLEAPELEAVEAHIRDTVLHGRAIRDILGGHSGGPYDDAWEVQAAVEALGVFGSRWTIEILSALYIVGAQRFNQLKHLLAGISSRTLSDKLKLLEREGLLQRLVNQGPPIRVTYTLTDHGMSCGRLLSPLVAFLKLHHGSVDGPE